MWTPTWKDAQDGLIHIVGTHSSAGVWAECGRCIAGPVTFAVVLKYGPRYTEAHAMPTCIACIGSAVDYLPQDVSCS